MLGIGGFMNLKGRFIRIQGPLPKIDGALGIGLLHLLSVPELGIAEIVVGIFLEIEVGGIQ